MIWPGSCVEFSLDLFDKWWGGCGQCIIPEAPAPPDGYAFGRSHECIFRSGAEKWDYHALDAHPLKLMHIGVVLPGLLFDDKGAINSLDCLGRLTVAA